MSSRLTKTPRRSVDEFEICELVGDLAPFERQAEQPAVVVGERLVAQVRKHRGGGVADVVEHLDRAAAAAVVAQ